MNQWQNGQTDGLFNQQTPNQLNSAMFSNLNSSGQFDLNGASSFTPNGTQPSNTAFPNHQTFAPGSVVPQKRPHDGGMSGSPPPPNSRSQTPNFNAFTNQQPQQQMAGNTPYGHLQQTGSAQATPSPTMQNQPFRQPSRMSNASPSPFPNQAQGMMNNQQMQGAGAQNNMTAMNQFGMNMGMGSNNMATTMAGQGNNMNAMMAANQQRQYQLRLMQQQNAMRQQQAQQNGNATGATPMTANQMQAGMMNNQNQLRQQQMKRASFLQQCGSYVTRAGRPFNPNPVVSGKPLDLYNLFTCVISGGGSGVVDRNNQWQSIALKLGFNQMQFPNAAEEIKQVFLAQIALYEKAWMAAKVAQKQQEARLHAQQMANFGGQQQQQQQQASPTKTMQMPGQAQQPPSSQAQSQPAQQQTFNQFRQPPPNQTSTPQPPQQATPVQANASLPQNGTPQSVPGNLQHRRNSSMRKTEALTPQPPTPAVQQSPVVKKEPTPMEPRSTEYEPTHRAVMGDGGWPIQALFNLGTEAIKYMPIEPTVAEMGTIDTRAITLCLASGIHAEVRWALDALCVISAGSFELELKKCEDLIDVLTDCAEIQTDTLADKADEVSDSVDLLSYEDIMRHARLEAETLQDVPVMGSQAYELDRAADRVIAITTILRNFSFYESNHRFLTVRTVIKWLSNTLRLLGTRNMFLRTYLNLQDFYKDVVIFLSNITQSLELPSREDALHVLHFLLAFTPQPAPSYTQSGGKLTFMPFTPNTHRYLPPAVDSLAKLLARQDPNRVLYRSIFQSTANNNTSEEDPIDLLTRAFALAISVLPDRNKSGPSNSVQLRIVEARKAYLTQGMLAADILTTLLPSGESDVARAWLDSEDGWANSLLGLASLLSINHPPRVMHPKQQPMMWDIESFRLITHRALSMMKRLAEKAGKGSARRLVNGDIKTSGETSHDFEDDETGHSTDPKQWEGIPQRHAIIGAMMMGSVDRTALDLLCGLHELAA